MASTESKIRLIFDGVERGVVAAAAKAKAAVKSLSDENDKLSKSFDTLDKGVSKVGAGLLGIAKGITVLGTAAAAGHVIAGTVGSLAQLAPIALALPGALLVAGAAFGTLAIATSGFNDAIAAGLHGDMAAYNEAIAAMPPAMRDAAKAVVSFRGELNQLKTAVQGAFWEKFSGDITALGNNLLPTLKQGMRSIAAELGNMVKGAVQVASTPFFRGQLASILVSTRATIENMRPALGNVLAGFVSLGEVGATFLPRLGTAITNVTTQFKAWATSVEGQNQIKTFIEGAITGFKDLAGIVKNVGSILGSIFTGLGGSIASPLASLKELTAELAAFLKTAEAQEGLKALGEILQEAGTAIKEVFLAAVKELLPTIKELAPGIKALILGFKDFALDLIATVGPALRELGKFLGENKDIIRDLVPFVLSAVLAFKGLKVLTEVIGWAKGAKTAIQTVVDVLPGVKGAASKASAGISALFTKTGLKATLWAVAIVAAVDVAIGAIKGYTEEQEKSFAGGNFFEDLKIFWDEFKQEPFQAVGKELFASLTPPPEAQDWFKRIGQSFKTDFIDVIAAAPGQIGAFFSSLGSTISTAASTLWEGLKTATSTAFDAVVGFVTGLPTRIGEALAGLGTTIATAASTAWESLKTATSTAIDAVVAFVTDLPFKVGFALGLLAGTIAAAATAAWEGLKTATTTAIAATVTFVTELPGKIGAALSALGATIVAVATTAWQSFKTAVTTGAQAAVDFVKSVPGLIGAALSSLASTLSTAATTAWNAFTGAIKAAFEVTAAFVRGIPGRIVSALSSLGGQLSSSGRSAWDQFTSAVRAAFDATLGFVRGIPGRIVSALGSLGGLLIGAGRALMNGFFSGIRAVAASITNFVSGFMAGIRAYFPFSPAEKGAFSGRGWTLFAGQSLIEGFAEGISSRSGLIASAADAAMRAAQLSMSSPLGLSISAPSPTAGALQQLLTLQSRAQEPPQVRVFIGDTELTDIVRTEVNTSNRATRRTVGAGGGTTF